MAHVGTFVEAVCQGCVRFRRHNWHAVGKMSSGIGGEGDDGSGDVADGHPAIINNRDTPKAIFGVTPPLQDGFPVEGDFATCFVEKYLTTHVAQDDNEGEIADKAGESMS